MTKRSLVTKIGLLFFFLLVCNSLVCAAPPFEQGIESDRANTITVVAPVYFTYEYNNNVTLDFAVLNSNFSNLDDTQVECNFILTEGKSGENILTSQLEWNTEEAHWDYIILANNTESPGIFSYFVYCNSTEGEFGYISKGLQLVYENHSGEDLTPITALIMIPLFLSFLCMASIFLVGEGHAPIKYFMYIMSFISISVSYNYMIKVINIFYSATSLSTFVAEDYGWYGYLIYIVIIYFIIHWMIQMLDTIQKRKVNELKFEDGKK